MATPPPPDPAEPTTCEECQDEQEAYASAYSDLESAISDVSVQAFLVEEMLNALDPVDAEIALSNISTEEACEDDSDILSYYSSFEYDESLYCFGDEAEYDLFFNEMLILDPVNDADWTAIADVLLYMIIAGDDAFDSIEELLDLLDELLDAIKDCEKANCTECPDCETIADDLQSEFDDLEYLEEETNKLYGELVEIENQIDEIWEQLSQLETLRNEFRNMVLDAGGMVNGDCDEFKPEAGQAWGIAHNFGDVQWCLTSEGQIENLIENLDEYWKTNNSTHLPDEEELNEQVDLLMAENIEKLDEYAEMLDQIKSAYDKITELIEELEDCIDELQALQDENLCLDQDIEALREMLEDATEDADTPYEPSEPEEEDEGFDDIEDHWAEDFINELREAGVVSGDPDTNNFRPNDPINRAESSKIVILANEDTPAESFFDIFTDVLEDSWYWSFVNAAQELGYFEGYEDGSFGPGNSILRAEAAAVVLRVAGFEIPEYETYSFPDIEGDEWYADYAERAYQCGIFEGRLEDGENVFAGTENITRAEFSKIVNVTIFHEMLESECNDIE